MEPKSIAEDKELYDVAAALKEVAGNTERYMDDLYNPGMGEISAKEMNTLVDICKEERAAMDRFLIEAGKRGYNGSR